jgi:hypothetical protein
VNHDRFGSERDVLEIAPYYVVDDKKNYTTFGATQDWAWSASEGDIVTFGADIRQMNSKDTFHSIAYQDPDDPEPPPPGEYPIIANGHFEPSGSSSGPTSRIAGGSCARWCSRPACATTRRRGRTTRTSARA